MVSLTPRTSCDSFRPRFVVNGMTVYDSGTGSPSDAEINSCISDLRCQSKTSVMVNVPAISDMAHRTLATANDSANNQCRPILPGSETDVVVRGPN